VTESVSAELTANMQLEEQWLAQPGMVQHVTVPTSTRLGTFLVNGKKLRSFCTTTIPMEAGSLTTVTATISSHDVYTKLYAEETRKQVKSNTVFI